MRTARLREPPKAPIRPAGHPYRVTNPRTPRPDPGTPRTRPTPAGGGDTSSTRGTRVIAVIAVVVAVVALGLAAWRFVAPAGSGCQSTAWDVTPADTGLPDGWALGASQYDVSRKSISLLGPAPVDDTTSQAVVYATITCFPQGAEDSVARSQKAAEDAGQSVVARDDLGDQAFSSTDESGAMFLQLRHGDVVVYLAASGDATQSEVDTIASAFDKSLGGDGGAISAASVADLPSGAPAGSGDLPSDSASGLESPAAPELEAALPTKVGSVALATDSAAGASILSDDQGSRAILAALRDAGLAADALKVAQAYDEAGTTDLSILDLSVDGMPIDAVQKLVMDSWLAASGSGVTKSTVKLGGQDWTRIDWGDSGAMDYVRSVGKIVFVITTADAALAEQAAAALP